MKMLLVIVAFFGFSASSFAETYQCEDLRDSAHYLYALPQTYSIEVTNSEDPYFQEVNLHVRLGADLKQYPMEVVHQVDDANVGVYRALDVTASVTHVKIKGRPVETKVGISRFLWNGLVSADCKLPLE